MANIEEALKALKEGYQVQDKNGNTWFINHLKRIKCLNNSDLDYTRISGELLILKKDPEEFIIFKKIGGIRKPKKLNNLYHMIDYLWNSIRYHKRHGCDFHYEVLIQSSINNPIANIDMTSWIIIKNNKFKDRNDFIKYIENKIYRKENS